VALLGQHDKGTVLTPGEVTELEEAISREQARTHSENTPGDCRCVCHL